MLGLLSLWMGVAGEFSYKLMFLFFGLVYIIVKSGDEMDKLLDGKD